MSESRKTILTPEEIEGKILARQVRSWGGVFVGVACVVAAFTVATDQVVPVLLVACGAFGIADVGTLVGAIKR